MFIFSISTFSDLEECSDTELSPLELKSIKTLKEIRKQMRYLALNRTNKLKSENKTASTSSSK